VDVCGHFRLLGSLKNKDKYKQQKKSDVAVATSRPKMYYGDAAYQLAKKQIKQIITVTRKTVSLLSLFGHMTKGRIKLQGVKY